MTAPNTLAITLQKRRKLLGLSSAAIAQRAGVARSTYLRLEAGQIADPGSDTLQAIADALDLPASDLYTAAGRLGKRDLPSLRPYLRTKYHLTDDAAAEIGDLIATRFGIDFNRDIGGPRNGEDE